MELGLHGHGGVGGKEEPHKTSATILPCSAPSTAMLSLLRNPTHGLPSCLKSRECPKGKECHTYDVGLRFRSKLCVA
jgi:hypothetical protein